MAMVSNYTSMGKRRFLKTMAGLGVSGAALQYLSRENLANLTDNPDDQVPRLSRVRFKNPKKYTEPPISNSPPEMEPVFYTIPRDRWEYIEGTYAAAERVRSILSNKLPAASSISVGVGPIYSGGNRDLGVKVINLTPGWEIDSSNEPADDMPLGSFNPVSTDKIRSQVPSSVTGYIQPGSGKQDSTYRREDVSTIVEERTIERQAYFNHHYRPVPGGCQIWDQESISYNYGTSATPIYSTKLNKHVLLTAGHLYDNKSDISNQPKYNFTKPNKIGEVSQRKVYNKFDAATIDPNNHTDLIYRLACTRGDDCLSYGIRGYIGEDELRDNSDNSSYYLNLQGRTTGSSQGTIDFLEDATFGGGNDVTRIWLNVDSDSGDSGGPHFKLVDEANGIGAYIAGVHGWGSGADAVSTSIFSILEHFDVIWT